MWQYLMDNDIDSDDWRYDVLSAVFANGTGDMSGIKVSRRQRLAWLLSIQAG